MEIQDVIDTLAPLAAARRLPQRRLRRARRRRRADPGGAAGRAEALVDCMSLLQLDLRSESAVIIEAFPPPGSQPLSVPERSLVCLRCGPKAPC